MKNIPRIFIGENIKPGIQIPVSKDIFSFLSSHSKETFIITLDNTSNSLVKVELVYD